MAIFPTRYSLLSATALNDYLRQRYTLRGTTCRLLIHNVSDTYLLESPDVRYIFKIYRDAHRKLEEINGEVELLNTLYTGGASVIRPMPDKEGGYSQAFQAAEGIRYGVLFTYAEGQVCPTMSDAQLLAVGQGMARIHNITAGLQLSYYRQPLDMDALVDIPLRIIQPAFDDGLEAEYQYVHDTATRVKQQLLAFDLSEFSHGYCHYDFLPKNFHFDTSGQITFFDFDFAGAGYLANDLASFYVHFFMDVLHNNMSQQEADRQFAVFIQGYRELRSLSEAELASIPYWGYLFWLFYFRFHYENFEDWSNFFFHPRFIKARVGWMKTWEEWYL
ncbi:phosphotransferase enzyme family protein [Parapedobacter koreensis]|uniref:Ser/Thr protein kinase RdoA involved in Cpx stress response, MazF antagonist n=1 Tax=Parapedobacter koreensis TaxID=332977 RepID=A0A1H7TG89_9SPHI|nr:phosphotransferase [Parapedobacter koreensis]SEL83841.1 Ser/Thr protein kinase RdoA involved in Cpx stress response, MazF antagonist [Parapedobacter koreensis]